MGLRKRKNDLIMVLRAHEVAKVLTPAQVATFRDMYSRARTESEQDEVRKVVQNFVDDTGADRFSRLLRKSRQDEDDDEIVIPPHARP